MSYTPPDLSHVLTNEQTMNSRLTSMRTILRTGLTNAGISYSQSDTINQLIDKYEILPILKTDVNVNPQTAGKLGTIYKMANVQNEVWSATNSGVYYLTTENDDSNPQFEENEWYYTAAFGEFNTTPGTYYYGDNNGWSIETEFAILGGWSGYMGIGFLVDENYDSSGQVKNYNPDGYIGEFFGACEGYPGMLSLNENWGLPKTATYDTDHSFASGSLKITKKSGTYGMDYVFKDGNGNVIMDGNWEPWNVWNSDIIKFGIYASRGYKDGSNYSRCEFKNTKIYYEDED